MLNGITHPLKFIPPNETRKLVGAMVNPANESKHVVLIFQYKVAALASKLNSLLMHPCDVLIGHKVHW